MSSERAEFRGRDGNLLVGDAVGDPSDPPVVLLHGGGQTRHSWGTTLDNLGTHGWRAYSIDLRGHGDSEWAADGDYTLDALAGDVVAISRSLDAPPALVGASLGGISSLAAIGEHPDETIARALVLVDVAPRIEEAGRNRIGEFMMEHMESGFGSLDEVADAIQRYNPHRPRPTNLAGLEKNLRRRDDDGRWYWHWDPRSSAGASAEATRRGRPWSIRRLQAAARAVHVPTLLVRGRMSDLLSEEGARELLELVPQASYVDVAGAGPHGRGRPERRVQRRGGLLPRRGPRRLRPGRRAAVAWSKETSSTTPTPEAPDRTHHAHRHDAAEGHVWSTDDPPPSPSCGGIR